MSRDEWVETAMNDDNMVVELLLRFNQCKPTPPPPKPKAASLEWRVRQRRSKPVALDSGKKQALRDSPTTPLSWSGATSISGGFGGAVDVGAEESSRPKKLSKRARSEVNATGDKNPMKRSRKKKTLAELQVEEHLLDKERRELKKEIAALRANLAKQKAANISLKRIELESQELLSAKSRSLIPSEEPIRVQLQQHMGACDHITPMLQSSVSGNDVSAQSHPANEQSEDKEVKFVLPDLNLALVEDPASDVLCGIS